MPTTKELATASSAAYAMSKKGTRVEKILDLEEQTPTDYFVMPQWTNADISTFQHNDSENPHFIIAHRGTDVHGTSKKKDLLADVNLIVGNTTNDNLHKKRTNRTEKIVKGLKGKGDIHLTGHSLGGSTAHHSMVHSTVVRDNVTSLDTFNAGSSPFLKKDHKKDSKEYLNIEEKTTHHHMDGDEISKYTKKGYIGKHKTYKTKKKHSFKISVLKALKPLMLSSPLGQAVNFVGSKVVDTINAHSIQNFF